MSLDVAVETTFSAPGAEPFDVEVSLSVEEGETLVVLGPSGSGKTLFLETVAGYHAHGGHVHRSGTDITDDPPEDRGFGFVFQNYALFPHMTVRENVAFGSRYHPEARDPDELLAEFDITHLADRTPETLSGGEAQRVALARALAIRPSTLLLDEPLSSLDVPTRQSLRDDLAGVLADVTSLYVTHNRTTARVLADRIAVMDDGRVVQTGTPDEVFEAPATVDVASFVGANVLPAARFDADGVGVAVRPEHVTVDAGSKSTNATVERVDREDAASRVVIDWDGERVDAFSQAPPAVGSTVEVGFPEAHRHEIPHSAAEGPSDDR